MTEAAMAERLIYIADDEPANATLLERILGWAGLVNVRLFVDGSSLLAAMEVAEPDIVLLDLHMPGVDGFDVLEALGRRPVVVPVPVLVLTGDASRDQRSRALGSGASDFITKPVDREEVVLRVRNLLARRALELALNDQNASLGRRVAEQTHELRDRLGQLRRAMEQSRSLASRLVTAQEEERSRIAEDIHDDTIQTMVAVGIRMELLRRSLTGSPLEAELDQVIDIVRNSIHGLRNLMFDLHPAILDREGLGPALEAYVERVRAADGPAYAIRDDLVEHPPAEIRATLFRIAVEAVVNARKHARAQAIAVTIEPVDDGYAVRIADDGVGFDVAATQHSAPGHLGLSAMRERASLAGGRCRIESEPGHGTTVDVWLPGTSDRADRWPAMEGGAPAAPIR
jgi:signal transduction histidine kinase